MHFAKLQRVTTNAFYFVMATISEKKPFQDTCMLFHIDVSQYFILIMRKASSICTNLRMYKQTYVSQIVSHCPLYIFVCNLHFSIKCHYNFRDNCDYYFDAAGNCYIGAKCDRISYESYCVITH